MTPPRIVVEPALEPVSLDELKQHLRITGDEDDLLLDAYIRGARRHIETRLGRTIHATTWEVNLERWTARPTALPMATPLLEIQWIRYRTEEDQTLTVDPSIYTADLYSIPGRVRLAPHQSWPSDALWPMAPITIRYRAGMTGSPPTDAPEQVRIAMLLLIGSWYENREALVVHPGISAAVTLPTMDALLAPLVVDYAF